MPEIDNCEVPQPDEYYNDMIKEILEVEDDLAAKGRTAQGEEL